MLKNERAQNLTKPTPLCLARLPDFGGIFTLSNGLLMRKLSPFDRKPKQGKSQRSTGQKVNDDVIMLTVQEMKWHSLADGDWASLLTGHTCGRLLDQSMVVKWHLSVKWESATWPNHGQPRGTQSKSKWQVPKKFGVHEF